MKNLFRKTTALLLTLCMIVGMTGFPATAYAEGLDSGGGDAAIVATDKNDLAIGYSEGDSADSVTGNLTLVTTGATGSAITWQSDTPEVIADDGAVTRPDADAEDTEVTLTAMITYGGASDTKEFTVTVLKAQAAGVTDVASIVAADKAALEIGFSVTDSVYGVTENLTLPVTAVSGSAITWQSSDTDVIANDGTVTRPDADAEDVEVTLTATITYGEASDTKEFTVMVLKEGELGTLFGTLSVEWEGSGSEGRPYEVSSPEHLADIPNQGLDKHYIQTVSDIDLSGYANWTPIGDYAAPEYNTFTGTYDGDGNTISNLTINDGTLVYAGLFGRVGSGGNLMNIKLESASVSSTKNSAFVGALAGYNMGNVSECSSDSTVTGGNGAEIGGLVGYNNGGTISQSSSDGTVTGGSGAYVGGLVGRNNGGTISQSISSGTVTGGGNGATLGGLVGVNQGHITGGISSASVSGGDGSIAGGLVGAHSRTPSSLASIHGSSSSGNVSGGGEYSYAGGLVGNRYTSVTGTSDMTGNSSTGHVTGGSGATLGGLIGYDNDGSGSESIYTLDGIAITSTSTDHKTEYTVGEELDITGLVVTGEYIGNNTAVLPVTTAHISGFNSSAPATGLELTVTYDLKTAIFTVDISWPGDGSGTDTDPYKVATPEQLNAVRYYLNDNTVHFEQTAPIDLSGYSSWTPIGDAAAQFKGTYDGGGYTVDNLTIDLPDADNVGLFGYLNGNGSIKNLSITNADVTGNINVGILVGNIENSGATIENCSAGGTVTGYARVGGLIGSVQHAGAVVKKSFSTAAVSSTDTEDWDDYGVAGGFAGYLQGGLIEDCYASGIVSGFIASGFMGAMEGGTVRRCYAIGAMSGEYTSSFTNHWGGLVEDCYYDYEGTGLSPSDPAEGKSTAEMKRQNTFSGWDFSTVWEISEDEFYPTLRWQTWTSYERLAADWNALHTGFIRGNNASLAAVTSKLNLAAAKGSAITWSASPVGYVNTGTGEITRPTDADKTVELTASMTDTKGIERTKEFTVIIKKFSSVWQGDGSAVNPYQVESAEHLDDVRYQMGEGVHFKQTEDIVLSGYANWTPIGDNSIPFTGIYDGGNKTITGLTIDSDAIQYVGLFGYVGSGGRLENIELEAVNISSRLYNNQTGGLAGYNAGTITSVKASNGVINETGNGTAGGLVGINKGTITASRVSGNEVTSTRDAGGLVGGNNGGTIENSGSSSGIVISSGSNVSVGGLVGVSYNGNIHGCFSTNAVTGRRYVGGLIGSAELGAVSNSYSTGSVTQTGSNTFAYLGGFVSIVSYGITITNCYSTGDISSIDAGNVGGLVGYDYGGTAVTVNSYYLETAAASSAAGEPLSEAALKQQSSFIGWNFDTVWRIAEGVTTPALRWQPLFPDERITADRAALDWNAIKGANSGADNVVTTNLVLPGSGAQGSTITWSAVPTGYINISTGAITPPTDESKPVTLTATVSYTGGTSQTVDFPLTIIAHYAVTYHANGGTGTVPTESNKAAGATFTAAAANAFTAPSGKQFKHWNTETGGTGTSYGAGGTVTMPTGPLDLYAIWEDIPPNPTYYVTITANTGGSITSGTSGNYEAGTVISISASPASGYRFVNWTTSSGGSFGSATSASTTFTVPANATTVTATFTTTGGGSGGGSSGGSSSGGSGVTVPPEKKPDQPVVTGAELTPTVDKNGLASTTVPDQTIADAIKKAQEEAKKQEKTANGIGVSLDVNMPEGASSLSLALSQNALQSLVNANAQSLEIGGGIASLNLDLEALKEILKQSSGNVTITIKPVQNLSAAAKKLIGTRPVYDVTISYVKDGKTVNITSLGTGNATLSFPYTPGKNEAVGYLFGVYVDGKGNASRIPGSAYDANSGSILLGTDHLSVYGVGYASPTEKYTDIANHWAKESIDYAVGRGLFSGTTEKTFSPNMAMDRGMLVTVLGRLAGADVSTYKTSSFSDVAAGKYYLPYVEWAYKKGIISGTGNGKFAPERAVTREEIALILQNYAKATGYKLPVTREAITFADNSSIGSSYTAAVKAVQQAGIMVGGSGNKFNPKAGATRAEVAAMLHRYVKLTIDPATAQGWALKDDGRYMYYKDGKPLTGWQTIDGKKYYFYNTGVLQTGWVKDGNNWRYYSGNKALVGWWDIGSETSKKRYYFDVNAIMVSGKWLQIDGKWYYFYSDGSLAKDTKIDGYEVDKNGVRKAK